MTGNITLDNGYKCHPDGRVQFSTNWNLHELSDCIRNNVERQRLEKRLRLALERFNPDRLSNEQMEYIAIILEQGESL